MSATRPLLLVGAGGFARETAETVRAVNETHRAQSGCDRWDLRGFLDDDPARAGTVLAGHRVLGGLSEIAQHPEAQLVVTTGNPGNFASKRRIVERLDLPPERYATVVHPTTVLPAACRPGPGSVLLAAVVATVDVHIGSHVAMMPQVVLTHDDQVEDYAILGAGVRLAGGVRIGRGAYIGSGALIRENRSVGEGALVGMGAVVTRDVPPGEVWAGTPARFVRRVVPS